MEVNHHHRGQGTGWKRAINEPFRKEESGGDRTSLISRRENTTYDAELFINSPCIGEHQENLSIHIHLVANISKCVRVPVLLCAAKLDHKTLVNRPTY